MCTAVYYSNNYLGRNLDLFHRYKESVTITPCTFPLRYRYLGEDKNHFSAVGMATVADGFPLYYDGLNQHGLGICALNFVGYCKYTKPDPQKICLASHELIPYILTGMKSVAELRKNIAHISLTADPFSEEYKTAQLHYIVADRKDCVVLEPGEDGIRIYDNPIGVLTNNPSFDYHSENIRCYLNLTGEEVKNRFTDKLALSPFSGGTGAMGLPGDGSSSSRFVRAAFNLLNAERLTDENEAINQTFHILDSVAAIRGTVKNKDGSDMTQYSSVMSLKDGIYYYKTYSRSRITAVKLDNRIQKDSLISFPMRTEDDIFIENPR